MNILFTQFTSLYKPVVKTYKKDFTKRYGIIYKTVLESIKNFQSKHRSFYQMRKHLKKTYKLTITNRKHNMIFKEETANEIAISNTAITAEHIVEQIPKLVKYLQEKNIHTGPRLSAKGIFQLFSNIAFPKALSTQLRKDLEGLGLVGGANGNIPFYKITEHYIALVMFAIFTGNSYEVPKLDIETIEPQIDMYKALYSLYNEGRHESLWKNKMNELGLSEVQIDNDGSNICIVGEPIQSINKLIIDFPLITDSLPHGSYLINYQGSPRFYVENRCALKLTLQNISLMPVDVGAFFYQIFDSGTWTQEELDNNKEDAHVFPDCENIHKDSFFTSDSDNSWFEIQTVEAYILSLRTGVYQKYSNITELNGKDFFIMKSYLCDRPDQTEADERELLVNIFSHLFLIKDSELLELIRDDLKAHTSVSLSNYIDKNIDPELLK